MAAVGMTSLAFLVGLLFVSTVRLHELELLGVKTKHAIHRGRRTDLECTTEEVEDAMRCGVDQIIEQITDGLRCGFVWCTVPPLYLCADTCGITVDRTRTCEILISCPVSITLHIKGQTNTGSITNVSFDATLEDFSVTQDSTELQEAIDANKGLLLPMMQDTLDIALPIGNAMLHEQMAGFEAQLVQTFENDVVDEIAGIARFLLGGKGFAEGMLAAIDQRFSQIGAYMHRRFEVDVLDTLQNSTNEKLCHRLLRVRYSDGEFFIKDWDNSYVAIKVDPMTNCQTAYTAHCGTGTLIATTKCPLKDAKVEKKCLQSLWCWVGARSIKPEGARIALFRGDAEIETMGEVKIDHVEIPELGTWEIVATPGRDINTVETAELDSLVQIKDDDLPQIMKDEVCNVLRENAWYGFGALVNARCRLMFSTLFLFTSTSVPIQLGPVMMPMDISLKGEIFRIEFVPDWEVLSATAESALMAAIREESLPFGTNVDALNLELSGNGDMLYVEAQPVLTGVLSADTIDELLALLR